MASLILWALLALLPDPGQAEEARRRNSLACRPEGRGRPTGSALVPGASDPPPEGSKIIPTTLHNMASGPRNLKDICPQSLRPPKYRNAPKITMRAPISLLFEEYPKIWEGSVRIGCLFNPLLVGSKPIVLGSVPRIR